MIQTTHIQQMLTESLALAMAAHGLEAADRVLPSSPRDHSAAEGLRHASTLARHAAAELEMELDALGGWPA